MVEFDPSQAANRCQIMIQPSEHSLKSLTAFASNNSGNSQIYQMMNSSNSSNANSLPQKHVTEQPKIIKITSTTQKQNHQTVENGQRKQTDLPPRPTSANRLMKLKPMNLNNRNLFLNEDDVDTYITYPPKNSGTPCADIASPALPQSELQIQESNCFMAKKPKFSQKLML